MTVTVNRDILLTGLQQVIGAVERRNTLPILAHVLLTFEDDTLAITATDLEIELKSFSKLPFAQSPFSLTLPGRKLFDICKALPDGVDVSITQDNQKVILKAGRSRFTLSCLSSADFPLLDEDVPQTECLLNQKQLSHLIDKTQFAMAQQDVRYYLNGMLFEFAGNRLSSIATDGHRLAVCHQQLSGKEQAVTRVIVPRKGIQELARLLIKPSDSLCLQMQQNHIRFVSDDFVLTSKLIDGRFPDYQRVLPKAGNNIVSCKKSKLKQILSRVSILSNEKYRGIRFELNDNTLTVSATNPEQEQAEEEISVEYQGPAMSLGFNVTYLLDILSVFSAENLKIYINDANTGVLLEEENQADCLYVVMPMRI
ncbi:MAG: DNA polymerase III subunit beta [Legionellales bacterium]|nr:DNA polymerase III subunit beta [Legionellales bacterium]